MPMKTKRIKQGLIETYQMDVSLIPDEVNGSTIVDVGCFLHGPYEAKWNTVRDKRPSHTPGCPICKQKKVTWTYLQDQINSFRIDGFLPPKFT